MRYHTLTSISMEMSKRTLIVCLGCYLWWRWIKGYNDIKVVYKGVEMNITRCKVTKPPTLYHASKHYRFGCLQRYYPGKKSAHLFYPHRGYYTQEAPQRILETSLKNMRPFLAGKTPQNDLKLTCKKEC